MDEHDWLAERFETHRSQLRAVAYRMLGSLSEADDAVQEAWLRLSRSDTGSVENLGGWLTTVVGRVCLDMLRSRRSRREEPLGPRIPVPVVSDEDGSAPEHEALLADSVGLALLAVLDPDVVRRADRAALPAGAATELRGAQAVAEETRTNSQRARFAQPALVNGTVGIVVAPRGQLLLALRLTIKDDKIAEIDVIADPRASTSSTWPSSSTD
jgi:RNA polymerase sigma factor (sigma-70 family)